MAQLAAYPDHGEKLATSLGSGRGFRRERARDPSRASGEIYLPGDGAAYRDQRGPPQDAEGNEGTGADVYGSRPGLDGNSQVTGRFRW
jgi:hypothetical protein